MINYLKYSIYFVILVTINSNLYCENTLKNVLLEQNGFWNSVIYKISSFDDNHLLALQYSQISHLYLHEVKTVNLIEFTDWNVGLKEVSHSSTENIVFYGILFTDDPNMPLLKIYENTFLIANKDSAFINNQFKWIQHNYPDSIPLFVYSNVDENGNGLAISKNRMNTYIFNNWQEKLIYQDLNKKAVCCTFSDNMYNLIIERDHGSYSLLRSSDGYSWDSLGRINRILTFDPKKIKKLIVQNENDFYMITTDGFYYSNNKGIEGSWKEKLITTPGINDAIIVNNTDMYMCGQKGFVCKVNLADNSVKYFDNDANISLFTFHLTASNKLLIGGDYFTMFELDLGTGVDDENLSVEPLSVFPNPSANFITISETDTNLYTNYEIYDISGRLLQKDALSSNRIDVSRFEHGSYNLRLISPTGIANTLFLKMD